MNQENKPKEKSWFRRFIESPITIFIMGAATLVLIVYIISKIASNHKETMFALEDIIGMIPSIKV